MNIDTFFFLSCDMQGLNLALKCNLVNGHQDQVKQLENMFFSILAG